MSEDQLESFSVTFKRDRESDRHTTIHGVTDQIVDLAPELLKDQKHRIQAVIKRLIHAEKLALYQTIARHFPPASELAEEYFQSKIKTHKEFFDKSDAEIITWKVYD